MRSVHRSQTSLQNFTSLFSLEITLLKIFFRLLSNDLPAYKIEPLSNMRIKQHNRSKKITFDIRKNKKFSTNSFIAQAIPSLLILD